MSYYFFWAMCVSQILGLGITLGSLGKERRPYSIADIIIGFIMSVLFVVACLWMEK
jgi:hypothetical protein